MEKVLVTGGAGFIGSHVCDSLLAEGKRVICVDNFNDYYSPEIKKQNVKDNLKNKSYALEEADISEFSKLKNIFEKYKPDKIIHLAARAGVRPSVENPFIYEETNIKGTLNLLELAKDYKIKNFVFGSTSSVYGKNAKIPFSESDKTENPISPYAATKKAGEVLCYTYSYLYKLNVTCLRFFTVYGPRGRPDMAPFLFTKLIDEGRPITMFGDGTTRRDYTFISDIVQGVLAANKKESRYEIFNLGNSKTVELRELISVIETLLGKKAKIVRKDIPNGDVLVTYADISKAKKYLNYQPITDIKKGMGIFVDWYKKNGV